MKLIFRLSFLVFVPIIVGFALVFSGHSAGAWVLALGVPAVMIALVIFGLILLIKGKLFENSSKDNESNLVQQSEKEQEQDAINAVNQSGYYTSQFKLAEYEAQQIIKGTQNASKKGMVAVIIIIILLLADVVIATVLTINQIWVGAIVCASLFGVSIVTILITSIIRQSLAMRGDVSKAEKMIRGKVISCVMSSMRTSESVAHAVRINGVVYRVVVNAGDLEYVTFSKVFYETDETVVLAVLRKNRVKIIEEADLENSSEQFIKMYNDCLVYGETQIN